MKRRALIPCFAACMAVACGKGSGHCLRKEGSVGDEERLSGVFFQNITVHNPLELYIRPHQPEKVVVTAGENLRDLIRTEVPEGSDRLWLKNQNACLWLGKYKATFRCTVSLQNLWDMRLENFGDVWFLDTLRTPYCVTTCNLSAGTVHVLVNNDQFLWTQNSGVMNLEAQGRCDHLFLYLKDRGHVRCENLKARTAYIFTEGSGPVRVHVTDTLTLLLDGLGDVYYSGQPYIRLLSHTGQGKLIHVP
ncbi:MAG: DUF2807 domain-containing protein [Flavobacteriales bacterium]|nr:DUF2807 domain-containing protein [Flavobacteriales bacterium]MDW8433161.1 DUF2807 domain-containing protein [Flavobacteriales bacterium]